MQVINPATGDHIESYEEHTAQDAMDALGRATEAFSDWKARELRERETLIQNAADVLRENKREYAEIITQEMGKPISQSVGEIEKCIGVCEHYGEYAGSYLESDTYPSPAGSTIKTVYEPLGPVLAVMPWNFPFLQVFRFAAPYLTAGNVGLLKHASNVPGCAKAIEEVFHEAGYPEEVFQTLLIPSDLVDDLIADDRLRAATLTGSGPAGRSVASTAGEHLKKTVLELGGSDPFIILDDADIDQATEVGAWARNLNGGQSCAAAKRFIVHTDVYDEFKQQFIEETEALTIGDPTDEETDIGPMARQDLMEDLQEQVQASVDAGAEVLTGGEPLDREGAYYPPTVLENIPAGCPADSEEVFGPVAALFEAEDEDEIVRKANDTEFGLGASIWTEDRNLGERFARQIKAGCTYVNRQVRSDPRIPFGGIKDSGYGRELSEAGIKEFVNRKTVWIA
jgi:succinate-semialdehyde dehydrogenase/glutarate-semialdehyde dehydrogenase